MHRVRSQEGYTLLEVLIVMALFVIVAAISFPFIQGVMQRTRARGAGNLLATSIRDAGMRAITTGFQYRVVAYSSTGTVPNTFRIEGSADGGATWPAAGTIATPPAR